MRFLVGMAVLFVGFGVVHRLVRGRWPGRRPRWLGDLVYAGVAPLIAKPVTQGLLAVPIVVAAVIFGFERDDIGGGFGPLADLPDAVQLALMLVLADGLGYWSHRAFHTVPWLWRFHAVHHSSPRLDWLAAGRVHPMNEILQRTPIAAALLGLGFETRVFAAVVPILTLHALLLHADVPWTYGRLGRIFSSPRFHRDHHAHDAGATNLGGLLTVWDQLFGTARFSAEEPTRFGVSEPVPDGVLASLWWPFRRR